MNPDDGRVPNDVDVLAERYYDHWQAMGNFYWCLRLLQEVGELVGSLLGLADRNLQSSVSFTTQRQPDLQERILQVTQERPGNTARCASTSRH